ncbi:aminotransferase class I/II-fold pyridoxal phosphate-dependent enzyme [Paractinoplanes rishiriensis]|uniref:Histidinol-phosphate aminotransferase n=1 Tax=Paractinoplanes rishiriensis TaxID=1050105 RepID=A0A919K8A6_9ACTN|nr:aminotransferase class I/II-fold pyridoxal phosphate-dependent enzyme [Actinoplanes rishiriensis]GIF01550.1 histidinol-phosphate aminotransferase [Actinoplanes rishiriensis]
MIAVSTRHAPGPSPAAVEAVRAVGDLGAAPAPDAGPLRQAIAAHYGIPEAAVRVGGGTAALLHGCIARQATSTDRQTSSDDRQANVGDREATLGRLICSTPSWPPYAQIATAYGMRPHQIPLAGYDHNLPAIAGAAGPGTRLVMLDSPHHLTGTTVDLDLARELAADLPPGAAVVYDNVYGEYQDDHLDAGIRDTIASGARVLICRTFSKAHQLFGLRVGYLLAHPQVMAGFGPLVLRYDVNQIAQAAALASLADPGHLAGNRLIVHRNRRLVTALLDAAGIACAPSQGHGVFFVPEDCARAADLLRAAGATVRTPDDHGVDGHLHLRVDDLPTDALCDTVIHLLELS